MATIAVGLAQIAFEILGLVVLVLVVVGLMAIWRNKID